MYHTYTYTRSRTQPRALIALIALVVIRTRVRTHARALDDHALDHELSLHAHRLGLDCTPFSSSR